LLKRPENLSEKQELRLAELVQYTDLNTMTAAWNCNSLILGCRLELSTIIGHCSVLDTVKIPSV
jgi:hypothetical protein